jgi:nucleoside diphosphate kinase
MMMSEKLIQRPSPSSSGRLFLLVLVTGLAVAMVLSMVFAGDAQAKKNRTYAESGSATLKA